MKLGSNHLLIYIESLIWSITFPRTFIYRLCDITQVWIPLSFCLGSFYCQQSADIGKFVQPTWWQKTKTLEIIHLTNNLAQPVNWWYTWQFSFQKLFIPMFIPSLPQKRLVSMVFFGFLPSFTWLWYKLDSAVICSNSSVGENSNRWSSGNFACMA